MHVAVLAGRLLDAVRIALALQEWGGLRSSHFRVLSVVPAAGASITELSGQLGMTKQAVGQFVRYLQDTGHVRVVTDAEDRRRHRVVRTPLGDDTTSRVSGVVSDLEQEWSHRVGAERYQHFRTVLEEIADVSEATRRSPP
jgi:DNA-binding MarR family transcriptional regulator